MKTPDQLKRETKALLEAEREKRLDREARDRRDGPILDAFDRMQAGRLASDAEPARRHPPRLQVVDAAFDVSDLDDQESA